jgi:hypothetical protein
MAMLMLALFTGRAGLWIWGRELMEANQRTAECEKRCEAVAAEWRERLRTEAEDYEGRIAKLEAIAARWEGLTLQAHGIAEVAAHALDKAVK